MLGGLFAHRGEVRVSRFRTQKNASLLAFLAYHRDRSHPREVLVDLLWPDHELEAGRNCLSVALSSLRSQFEGPDVPAKTVIIADRATVRLNPDTVVTDVHEFKQLLRKAKNSANAAEKVTHLESALSLYTGPLLPGYYEDWVQQEQSYLAETLFQSLQLLIEHAHARGDISAAIDYARQGASIDPLREDIQLLLIQLLNEAGRSVEALQHYRDLAAVFLEQTGLRPGPELRAAAQSIQGGFSTGVPRSISAPNARTPVSSLPAVQLPSLPAGTVTILAAESMPLSEPNGMQSLPGDTIGLAVRTNGGVLIGDQSPSINAVFGSASDALTAALQIQRTFQHQGQDKVRLVLDTGDIGSSELTAEPSIYHRLADHAALILAATHPGQTVVTEPMAALLRRDPDPNVALRDLGVFRFARHAERLAMATAPGLPDDFPRLNAAPGESPSVPISINRFFGRLVELEELERTIADPAIRLLTLTGPGGVGKTRLAAEASRRLIDRFDGRVYFASLPDNDTVDALPRALLTALRITPNPARKPMAEAVEALISAPALIILDNFDHMVETASMAVLELIEQAPKLKCLLTSRRPLNLSIEHEYHVAPLPLPALGAPLARLAGAEVLQFFVDRARTARPDFQLSRANAETLASVCIALEGIPLAIELAAARVSVLTEKQILAQLGNRLLLLAGGKRDAHRHRTMRSTIEWSYDLLPNELRSVFKQLSVFKGGFTLDAATEVCEIPDLFDHLWQLRQYSLIQVDTTSSGLRFRMLEMVREFAGDLLTQSGGAEALREKHWRFFYQFAHQACGEIERSNPRDWLDQLEQDQDNLRLALAYPATTNRRLCLCYSLHRFWIMRGYITEGLCCTTEVLDQSDGADINWLAAAESACGALNWAAGRLNLARDHIEKSLTLARSAGLDEDERYALNSLGLVLAHQGSYTEAQERFREIVAFADHEDPIYAVALGNLAKAEENTGEFESARVHQEECIKILTQSDLRVQLSLAMSNYGHLLCNFHEFDRAFTSLSEAFLIAYEMKDRSSYPLCLFDAALIATHYGDPETSAYLVGGSERLKLEMGIHVDPLTVDRITKLADQLLTNLGSDRWSALQEQAILASEEDLLKSALKVASSHANQRVHAQSI